MKTKRLSAHFIRCHIEGEVMYAALIFPSEGLIEVSSIENIELGGTSISDIPELVTCNIHLGDQTEADEMLLNHIPNWTNSYFLMDIAYLAIKANYDPMFDGVAVFADVTFKDQPPLGILVNNSPSIQKETE